MLSDCLESLSKQSVAADRFEICVVDDASGDETRPTLERLAQEMPNLKWVTQDRNRGPAAARNRGVSMSSAPLLILLDDDVVSSENLVRTHLDHHRAQGDSYGVLGHLAWHPSLQITPFMHWVEEACIQFNFAKMREGPQPDVWDAFYTCNLSMKRAAFERAGGFDERFPLPACEDSDLGARLQADGFVLDYQRDALAWHARPVSLDDMRRRIRDTAQSRNFFASLHPELGLPPLRSRPRGRRLLGGVKRGLLRIAVPVAPSLAGRDLRGMLYQSELGKAQDAGLRRTRTITP